jgi:hypothetical protein
MLKRCPQLALRHEHGTSLGGFVYPLPWKTALPAVPRRMPSPCELETKWRHDNAEEAKNVYWCARIDTKQSGLRSRREKELLPYKGDEINGASSVLLGRPQSVM